MDVELNAPLDEGNGEIDVNQSAGTTDDLGLDLDRHGAIT
jgi:hypothetical protein